MRPLRPRAGSGALGGALVHRDTTASTNDDARALALAGAPGGTVVVAEEQTAGRGRQGRAWVAPRGRALTLTLLHRLDFGPRVEGSGPGGGGPGEAGHGGAGHGGGEPGGALELLPLVVALAVCEACESVAPVRCRIKWPNDVWVGERKLGGILVEARPGEGWAAIGIGLNVDTTEQELGPELARTATSLRIETQAPVDRDRTLEALLDGLAARLDQLAAAGAGALLDSYRERDALRDRRISWSEGARTGIAQGIDERGNLIVFTEDGERLTLNAGEVHLVVTG